MAIAAAAIAHIAGSKQIVLASSDTPDQHPQQQVPVWDLPTRLFHWSLVALILCAYMTSNYAEAIGDHFLLIHRLNGLAILVLLTFRALWGVLGAPTARFSSFVRWPGKALTYASQLLRGRAPHYLGHNPLGAWMVIALLLAVAAQAFLGLFSSDDTGLAAGPLHGLVSPDTVHLLTVWHHRLFKWLLLPLIATHILVNLFYTVIKREPLIQAMVSGTKPALPYVDASAYVQAANAGRRALGCLVAAIVLVLGTIWIVSGKLV